MPPEGYTTLTLPNELVEEIDNMVGYNSRTEAIRALLSSADMPHEHEWPEPEEIEVDLSEVLGRIDDLENQLPRKVAEEVRHG